MITCVVTYTIDPKKIDAFESFARAWIERTFMRPLLPSDL